MPWGRYATEIRDPGQRRSVLLGTFDTPKKLGLRPAVRRYHGNMSARVTSEVILWKFSYGSVAVIPPRRCIISPRSFFRCIKSLEPETFPLEGIFNISCVPPPRHLPHTSL